MSKYEEKEAWFLEQTKSNYWKFSAASAAEFYRDLFPEGTFEERVGHKFDYEKTNRGNGFIVYTVGEGEKECKHTRMVFDDLAELYELLDNPCAFMSPCSYFGRHRTAKNGSFCSGDIKSLPGAKRTLRTLPGASERVFWAE